MKDESNDADVVIECELPHSPEHVWRAITDQDLVGLWLTPSDLRPEVGARFRLPSSQPSQDAPLVDCEVIEAIPNRVLRWRQAERTATDATSSVESIVTFELFPNSQGTRLRIIHDRFRRIPTQASASITNIAVGRRPKSSAATILCSLHTLRRAA